MGGSEKAQSFTEHYVRSERKRNPPVVYKSLMGGWGGNAFSSAFPLQYSLVMNTIEYQLQLLRERWKKEPEHRKTIELQAKVLQLSQVKHQKTAAPPEDPFVLQVAEALL